MFRLCPKFHLGNGRKNFSTRIARGKLSLGARPLGGTMKRTAATLALLAGFGGGCMSTDNAAKKESVGGFGTVSRGQQVPGVVGPNGEPIMAARGVSPSGVVQAGGTAPSGGIQQAGLLKSDGDCPTCAHIPGTSGAPLWNSLLPAKAIAGANGNLSAIGSGYGQPQQGPPPGYGHGILPVPGQGPPGAVAAVGALPAGGAPGAMVNGRSSVRFTGPAGMKITWQLPTGAFNDEATGLTAPKEYNFLQGQTYRLRLTQVLPNFPGKSFYPTLEVAPGNPKSLTFLAHASIPLTFTNDDFEQARSGNLVVKVIYLPDRENQDFATVAGAEEVVSTRLEPGLDPVAEAQRKGTILATIRLGNIDLENRASPPMVAPPPAMMMPRGGPPIMLPGPSSTTPGVAVPPKPISTSLPSIPVVNPSGSGSGSGSSKTTTAPSPLSVPAVAPMPSSLPTTGLPSSLPSIVPSPGSSDSVPTNLPPIK